MLSFSMGTGSPVDRRNFAASNGWVTVTALFALGVILGIAGLYSENSDRPDSYHRKWKVEQEQRRREHDERVRFYESQLSAWKRTFFCHRCGHTFIPKQPQNPE